MTEGFPKIGDRVECNLAGLAGREGLWHAWYPGSLIRRDSDGTLLVALDDFDRVWVDSVQCRPQRHDTPQNTRYEIRTGQSVHVLEYDGNVPVWWEAEVEKIDDSDWVCVQWSGAWHDHHPTAWVTKDKVRPAKPPAPFVRSIVVGKPLRYDVLLSSLPDDENYIPSEEEESVCAGCNTPYMSFSADRNLCTSCYVDKYVDPILDALTERSHFLRQDQHDERAEWCQCKRRMAVARAFILHVGGRTARRDLRLIEQFKRAACRANELVPEEDDEYVATQRVTKRLRV